MKEERDEEEEEEEEAEERKGDGETERKRMLVEGGWFHYVGIISASPSRRQ